jgi:uncharacterized SAM-binding protein YcdF (DUF218 family)
MLHRFRMLVRATLMAAGALLLLVTFTPLVPWAARPLCGGWTGTGQGVLIVLSGSTAAFGAPQPSRVIGESSYWRAMHAIYLWRSGHYRTLLLSGAHAGETMKPLLVANGIPESAILVEDRANSTRENALFLKPILAGLPGPFVLLTSDYHNWRARRCFAKENVRVETMPAPDLLKRCGSLELRWAAFWDLATEFAKIGYYRVKGWI